MRLAKEGSLFCYPENIDREMRRVFSELANRNFLRDLDRTAFAHQAAHLLAEINAIHPFREGNGRAQNTFLKILAERAGHSLDFAQLDPSAMLAAMIASFAGDEQPLAALIRQLIRG